MSHARQPTERMLACLVAGGDRFRPGRKERGLWMVGAGRTCGPVTCDASDLPWGYSLYDYLVVRIVRSTLPVTWSQIYIGNRLTLKPWTFRPSHSTLHIVALCPLGLRKERGRRLGLASWARCTNRQRWCFAPLSRSRTCLKRVFLRCFEPERRA